MYATNNTALLAVVDDIPAPAPAPAARSKSSERKVAANSSTTSAAEAQAIPERNTRRKLIDEHEEEAPIAPKPASKSSKLTSVAIQANENEAKPVESEEKEDYPRGSRSIACGTMTPINVHGAPRSYGTAEAYGPSSYPNPYGPQAFLTFLMPHQMQGAYPPMGMGMGMGGMQGIPVMFGPQGMQPYQCNRFHSM